MNKNTLLAATLLVSACTVQTYKPNASLQENAQQYEVKGDSVRSVFRENNITYGPYHSVVSYGEVTANQASSDNVGVKTKRLSFTFVHTTPAGDKALVECSSLEQAVGLKLNSIFIGHIQDNMNGDLICKITSQNDNRSWMATISNPFAKGFNADTKGTAVADNGEIVMQMRQEQTAYIFTNHDRDVAALAVDWNKRVWIKRDIEKESSLLSTVMMSIMLAKIEP